MSATSDPHDEFFYRFRRGLTAGYTIGADPRLPLFRKIDDTRISVVLWADEGLVREFLLQAFGENSAHSVVTWDLDRLKEFLDGLPDEDRSRYVLEVIM